MSAKIDIISGFLGAGKTTLMKKLLESKPASEKVVIIENEFGSVGIDGRLLKETGISVREINSGCICCTLAGDFSAALKDVIRKYTPDRVLIEPSGVGKLSDIRDSCRQVMARQDCEPGMCIAVVDVTKYAMYEKNFAEFFLDQIKNARTILLSRTQNASAELLESTVKSIQKHNPGANVVTTPWGQLSAEKILSVAEHKAANLIENDSPSDKQLSPEGRRCGGHGRHDHEHGHHHADEAFEVWSIETPKVFESDKIGEKLQRLAQYGTVLRAKGIVPAEGNQWIQFDYVPGEASQKETASDYTGRLCVIGQNLDKAGLAALFEVS